MVICFLSCILSLLPQLFALKAFRVLFSFDADQRKREGLLLAQVSTPTVIPMNCHTLIPSIHVPLLLGIYYTIDLTLMVNQFQA